jgi:hypothetical protein
MGWQRFLKLNFTRTKIVSIYKPVFKGISMACPVNRELHSSPSEQLEIPSDIEHSDRSKSTNSTILRKPRFTD